MYVLLVDYFVRSCDIKRKTTPTHFMLMRLVYPVNVCLASVNDAISKIITFFVCFLKLLKLFDRQLERFIHRTICILIFKFLYLQIVANIDKMKTNLV